MIPRLDYDHGGNLDAVLKHYGCSFDDVIVEDVFTTNMTKFLEVAAYRRPLAAASSRCTRLLVRTRGLQPRPSWRSACLGTTLQ